MRALTRFLRDLANIPSTLERTLAEIRSLRTLMAVQYRERLLDTPRYQDPLRLQRFERQVFSQNGEDGIIAEIFSRIGEGSRYFVEFGVENGLECNTTALLLQGWRGCWLECYPPALRQIEQRFADQIGQKLTVKECLVTAENIEETLRSAGVPADLDLLSIDIDGNDYWVWKAITGFKPRAVVIEYNSVYPPPIRWVKRYDPSSSWDVTSYFGASIASLDHLGREKGYSLVGCDLAGINAFFVRSDLCAGKFSAPFTAENHYEPSRFHVAARTGHVRGFGPFDAV